MKVNMSKTKPIYKLKETSLEQEKVANDLIENGLDKTLAQLYSLRGIEKYSDIARTENLISFGLLKDIGKAVSALRECILKKKKV